MFGNMNKELLSKNFSNVLSTGDVCKVKNFLSTNHFDKNAEYQLLATLICSNFTDCEIEDLICCYIENHGLRQKAQFLLFDFEFEKAKECLLLHGKPSDAFLEELWNSITERFFETLEVKHLLGTTKTYSIDADISLLRTIVNYSYILQNGGKASFSYNDMRKIKTSILKDVEKADFHNLSVDEFRQIVKRNLILESLSSALIKNEDIEFRDTPDFIDRVFNIIDETDKTGIID